MKTQHPTRLPQAILFDLDGTLVDSAPDLADAINRVQTDCDLAPTPYEQLRCVASAGAPGLIRAAFGIEPGHADYPGLASAFIQYYAAASTVKSTLFDGIAELLNLLHARHIPWGIVTNKKEQLTLPLVKAIGLEKAASIISGDTTARPKPYPEPVLEAARQIGVSPQTCWFIGDDPRDIQAGKTAGSLAIAAKWGYGTNIDAWHADWIAETPRQIAELIRNL